MLPLGPPSRPLPSYPSWPSQSTKLSSLCYTADSHQLSISYMVFMSIIISPHIPPSPSCPVSTNPSALALYFLFSTAVSDTLKAECAPASHNPATSPYFTQSENQSPYNGSQDLPGSLLFPSPPPHAIISPDLLCWFLSLCSPHSSLAGLGPAGTTWHKPSGP